MDKQQQNVSPCQYQTNVSHALLRVHHLAVSRGELLVSSGDFCAFLEQVGRSELLCSDGEERELQLFRAEINALKMHRARSKYPAVTRGL